MSYEAFDKLRYGAIDEIKALVKAFILEKISLTAFKEGSETLCRKYPYWGFKGFSGQMQLNQYVNNISDDKKEKILRESLICPNTLEEAESKITNLAEYLRRQKAVVSNPKSIPRTMQAFLLTYFWEIQRPQVWPIFYSSTTKVLGNLGVDLESPEYAGDKYHFFADGIFSIRTFYEQEKNQKFDDPIWYVEHVLWAQFVQKVPEVVDKTKTAVSRSKKSMSEDGGESWLPPVLIDIPQLALNRETSWSSSKNVRPEKAFETKLRFAFTVLGYEVEELGQGTGREPDGVALSLDVPGGDYALIYDAKARENGYSIGTDDRAIIEYIQHKEQELRRKRVGKLSFVIVSSSFSNSAATIDAVNNIYKATRVPVILLEAADLLYILEKRLKNTDIDHARLEHLFLNSGLLTREKIIEALG